MRWRQWSYGQHLLAGVVACWVLALGAGLYSPTVPVEGSSYRDSCGSVIFTDSTSEACQFIHDGARILALVYAFGGWACLVFYATASPERRREIKGR